MLVAVALSFAVFVRRLSLPHVMHLGRLGDSHDFVDMERHPDAKDVSGMIILRPAQPLFFGNAEPILAAVTKYIVARPELHIAIVSLEETFELDSTALDALLEFDAAMQRSSIVVYYARMHDHVKDLLLAGIRPGDTVWFAPGERHWHGAAPDVAMTHIALQEVKDGKVVDWMEHVTDDQYGG